MPSRLFLRRLATAAGLYGSTALGVLGTVVAANSLSRVEFGILATVLVAAGFFQVLLDLTVEESLTKYGFRYSESAAWGKLRALFRRALQIKLAGGLLATLALAALAPFGDSIFGSDDLTTPLLLAAALPLLQAPENVAGTAILLRGRYDLRAYTQLASQGLRLAAIVVGTRYGIEETLVALALAQVLATVVVGAVGIAAFRRFPREQGALEAEDRRELIAFVLQSSASTGLLSLRGALAPILLGIAAGPVQVGLFRIAQAPQSGFAAASSPVRLILLTENTRDWERGRTTKVLADVRRYSLAATAICLVTVPLFYWLMPELVELVFPDYLDAVDAARVMLLAAAVQLVFGWSKSLPVSIGRPNLRLLTHGIETAILLPLVVVLGLEWGVTGAALAVLVGSLVFAAAWTVLYARLLRDDARGRFVLTP
ncbi:MAG: oligosaccharide flippase family protein [Actinobacteria bacterium]|nr:oligosaccharide flippase family protein [Actinomycetota bacterium]